MFGGSAGSNISYGLTITGMILSAISGELLPGFFLGIIAIAHQLKNDLKTDIYMKYLKLGNFDGIKVKYKSTFSTPWRPPTTWVEVYDKKSGEFLGIF